MEVKLRCHSTKIGAGGQKGQRELQGKQGGWVSNPRNGKPQGMKNPWKEGGMQRAC